VFHLFECFHSKRRNTVLTLLDDMARGVYGQLLLLSSSLTHHHEICHPSDDEDHDDNGDDNDDGIFTNLNNSSERLEMADE